MVLQPFPEVPFRRSADFGVLTTSWLYIAQSEHVESSISAFVSNIENELYMLNL